MIARLAGRRLNAGLPDILEVVEPLFRAPGTTSEPFPFSLEPLLEPLTSETHSFILVKFRLTVTNILEEYSYRRREPTFSQARSNDQNTQKFHQKHHFQP